jgi:hypothetical protein
VATVDQTQVVSAFALEQLREHEFRPLRDVLQRTRIESPTGSLGNDPVAQPLSRVYFGR